MLKNGGIDKILSTVCKCMEHGASFYGMSGCETVKRDGSFVTRVDAYIEQELCRVLKVVLPEAGFIGEETDEEMTLEESQSLAEDLYKKKYVWVVDPLDGTRNYAYGVGAWAISIGLLEKGEHGWNPILGIVAEPMSGLVYVGDKKLSIYRLIDRELVEIFGFGKKLWEKDDPTDSNAVLFSINGSQVPKYKLAKGVSLISPACSVTQMTGVSIGSIVGTVMAAHIWDFAGAMGLGQCNGYRFFDTDTFEEVKGLTLEMFTLGCKKNNWRLKKAYYYCHPKHLNTLKALITKVDG